MDERLNHLDFKTGRTSIPWLLFLRVLTLTVAMVLTACAPGHEAVSPAQGSSPSFDTPSASEAASSFGSVTPPGSRSPSSVSDGGMVAPDLGSPRLQSTPSGAETEASTLPAHSGPTVSLAGTIDPDIDSGGFWGAGTSGNASAGPAGNGQGGSSPGTGSSGSAANGHPQSQPSGSMPANRPNGLTFSVYGPGPGGPYRPPDIGISDPNRGLERVLQPVASAISPSFSPGQNMLVFSSNQPGSEGIWVAKADGSAPLRITNAIDWDGVLSHDGKTIAFASVRGLRAGIFTVNIDGSHMKRLTSTFDLDEHPAWSVDDKLIAFARRSGASSKILTIDVTTLTLSQLTSGNAFDADPAWSLDGSILAFSSDRSGKSQVYTMNALGGDVTRVTTDGYADREPSFSPDGHTVAFLALDAGKSSAIYTIAVGGTTMRQVSPADALAVAHPTWSSDGTSIAYTLVRSTG